LEEKAYCIASTIGVRRDIKALDMGTLSILETISSLIAMLIRGLIT